MSAPDALVFVRDSSAGMPMLSARLSAGFPSPAEGCLEEPIDLKRFLVRHEAATFLMRVQGVSMEGLGIFDGDIAVIDRSLDWQNNSIVVARLGDEYTLKRISRSQGRTFLMPANEQYQPIELTPDCDAEIIAVLTFTIRQHHRF